MAKQRRAAALSHVDDKGNARMVDVGGKPVTRREALAGGEITMSAPALALIRRGAVAKGDPLQTARLAGIMAAKQTAALIPLCHPLALTHVSVELTPTRRGYRIEARVRTAGQTGVEMEALTAVSVAALTIYDMVKAVDKEMVIGGICLIEKKGGRSGHYRRNSRLKTQNSNSARTRNSNR
ncbi:MAG TPA: cyclic pyranopterin monophosphate synthase MoaC [Vicinamibacterales bacterium]|nr:cyclic pyranopterin monophosphate synthase MoaC [Vicinamibacterales bacterium]